MVAPMVVCLEPGGSMVALVVRASLAAPSDALTSSIFEDAESAAWLEHKQNTPGP